MDKAIISTKLQQFQSLFAKAGQLPYEVTSPIDSSYLLTPKKSPCNLPGDKPVGLTVMAITHGNEVGGIETVLQVGRFLQAVPELVKVPIALVLGNTKAAEINRRFVERDLNRSFDQDPASYGDNPLWEQRRARQLETLLIQTNFLLDIHQTIEPAESPFFIFSSQNHPEGIPFARAVDPTLPIVTHWGKPFSADGRCSDEYVIRNGGSGITLELGQNSFNPYQVAIGVRATLNAIRTVAAKLSGQPWPEAEGYPLELFTWGQVIDFPAGGALAEGWVNFKPVAAGEVMGQSDGGPIVADVAGKVLFPKYLRARTTKAPAEICRVLTPIQLSDIPASAFG